MSRRGRGRHRAGKGSAEAPPAARAPRADAIDAPAPADATGARGSSAACVLLLVALAVLPYARTWTYGFVYLDDVPLVREGAAFFADWRNLPKIFAMNAWGVVGTTSSLYRPLLLLPRFVEAPLFGAEPGPYHILNTLVHGASVVALFALLRRLVAPPAPALAVAALFAVHPVFVPAIAWIEGWNEPMLALLVLATLLCLLRALDTGRVRWAVASTLTFFLALLTKESALATPLLALALLWVDGREGGGRASSPPGARLGPTRAAIAGWTLAVAVWWQLRWSAIPHTPEAEWAFVVESLRDGWPGLLLYWGKIFLPFNLVPLPTLRDSSLALGAGSALVYGCATWWSRGRTRRALLVGALWFLVATAPSLLVSRLGTASGTIFREDRAYFASLGVFVALAIAVGPWLARERRATIAAVAIAAAGLLAIGQSRVGTWADGMAFWTAATKGSPNLSHAHYWLARMHDQANDVDGAVAELRAALVANPRSPGLHNELGSMLLRKGELAEAEAYFQAELAQNPGMAGVYYNQAMIAYRTGDRERATTYMRRYLEGTSDPPDSLYPRSAHAFLEKLAKEAAPPAPAPPASADGEEASAADPAGGDRGSGI